MYWSLVRNLISLRTVTCSLIGACSLLAYTGGVASVPAMAAATRAAPAATATAPLGSAPSWLSAAMPYVHVKHFVATIDPRLTSVLDAGDLAIVRADVARYNAAPMSIRTIGITHTVSMSLQTAASAYSACSPYVRVHSYNWWGVQFFVNDCYAENLAAGVTVLAAAAALLFLVPGLDVLVAALEFMLLEAAGSVFWADVHCGHNGAYLNVPWVPAAVWGSSIC